MTQVNIHYAKTHLSALIEKASEGEEIIVAKAGHPVAKIVCFKPKKRVFGHNRGTMRIAEDFDAPHPEIEKLFS